MAIHYLDNACLGRASARAAAAAREMIIDLANFDSSGTGQTIRLFAAVEAARLAVASFVKAPADNIVLVDNTTQGLGLVIGSLPFGPCDNILMDDQEFLGAAAVCRSVGEKSGVELRRVTTTGGRVEVADFARCADPRTRAVVLSSVQEVSGYRADVRQFAEFAHGIQAWLVIDGIQEVGALPVDLSSLPVDAYCAGGHKWLRSPFGLGFLYVAPRLLDILKPPFQGYMALDEPPGGWDLYLQRRDRTAFDPIPVLTDARRLETGGIPNWIGAVALKEAVDELAAIGAVEVWQRTSALTRHLRAGLETLGLHAAAGGAQDHQSGIVCFALPGAAGEERKLQSRLAARHVYVSVRYIAGVGGLRVSPHHDNTLDDIDELLAETRRFL